MLLKSSFHNIYFLLMNENPVNASCSCISGGVAIELFREIGEGIVKKGVPPKSIEDQTPTEASQVSEPKSCC